jgi:hypothetical protein
MRRSKAEDGRAPAPQTDDPPRPGGTPRLPLRGARALRAVQPPARSSNGHRAQRRPATGWRLAAGAGAGQARGFLRFWPLWERFRQALRRARPVPGAPHGLLVVRFTAFRGRPIELPDGTRVAAGDLIAELHLHNPVVSQVAHQADAWDLLRMFIADLRAFAAWSQQPDFPSEMRALYGVTLLGRAGTRLGFTLRERTRTLRALLDRFFMTGLLALYSPKGIERLRQGTTYGSYPIEIWISRRELVRRYGEVAPAQPPIAEPAQPGDSSN